MTYELLICSGLGLLHSRNLLLHLFKLGFKLVLADQGDAALAKFLKKGLADRPHT